MRRPGDAIPPAESAASRRRYRTAFVDCAEAELDVDTPDDFARLEWIAHHP